MVLSGSKKVSRIRSLVSKGCHFGSMPGIAPQVGRGSWTSVAYKQNGITCDCLGKIRFDSCADQYQYLKDKNLIFNCKLTGGVGRQPFTKNCAAAKTE
jgi:hypothetical protein